MIDVATSKKKKGMLQEILYAADFVLMAETMAELNKRNYCWKSADEGKGVKVKV